ncbi:DUF2231 domain-containing protein [Cognatilysobacter lacus]|uniref:DUF2231 domain-containing protein n=1 Tax=Cognatilysobacter lacus TaxID=1643323 RepID=A0A5D8YT29_9GAMM|nr:DUF2231 domain-containing protein [Lysobacter lacus]TZF85102.1 hypothetical protein FW784_12570 [Lysobacter lacus]
MRTQVAPRRSPVANAVFNVLNPIPFGCFVAALIFDVTYARTAQVMWTKGAAWLIVIGLLAAIVPRLVDLAQTWFTARHASTSADRLDFWLNLFAIVAAIFNAFVHSRDAYAVVPEGQWLSALTVALIAIGHVVRATLRTRTEGLAHG